MTLYLVMVVNIYLLMCQSHEHNKEDNQEENFVKSTQKMVEVQNSRGFLKPQTRRKKKYDPSIIFIMLNL